MKIKSFNVKDMTIKNSTKNLFACLALTLSFLIFAGQANAAFYYDTVPTYSVISELISTQLDSTCYLPTDFVNGQFCTGGKRPQDLNGTDIACKSDAEIKTAMQTQWTSGKQYTCKTNATPNMCTGGTTWRTECASPTTCTVGTCCKPDNCAALNRNTTGYDWCTGATSNCGLCLSGYVDGDGNDVTRTDACTEPVIENYWTKTVNDISSNNTGNVGIGTATPAAKLHIAGSDFTAVRVNVPVNGGIQFTEDGSNRGYFGIDPCSTNDNSVGICSDPAYKKLSFGTSGTAYMTINNGNVGIGTASPSVKLHVLGASTGATPWNTFEDLLVLEGTAASGGAALNIVTQSTVDPKLIFSTNLGRDKANIRYNTLDDILILRDEIYITGDNEVGIGTQFPGSKLGVRGNMSVGASYYNSAAPTSGMIVEGNVGIGDSTPAYKLDVNGQINSTGAISVDDNTMISSSGAQHIAQYTDDSHYGYYDVKNASGLRGAYFGYGDGASYVNLNLDNASALYVSGGDVGIGTNTPQGELHIHDPVSTGMAALRFSVYNDDDSSVKGLRIAQSYNGDAYFTNYSGDNIYFSTNAITKMQLTGSTSNTSKAYIGGSVSGISYSGAGIMIGQDPASIYLGPSSTAYGAISWTDFYKLRILSASSIRLQAADDINMLAGGYTRLSIDGGTGAVTISENLTVNGSHAYFPNIPTGGSAYSDLRWNSSSGGLYAVTSSRRYKDNIQPMQEDFGKILNLEPKSFQLKNTGENDFGYIAEEADELGLKNLVIYNKDGQPESFKYEMVALYLLEVIKNQQSDIQTLKTEVNALKSQINN